VFSVIQTLTPFGLAAQALASPSQTTAPVPPAQAAVIPVHHHHPVSPINLDLTSTTASLSLAGADQRPRTTLAHNHLD